MKKGFASGNNVAVVVAGVEKSKCQNVEWSSKWMMMMMRREEEENCELLRDLVWVLKEEEGKKEKNV